ncbi:MAG: hypothetical protein AAFP98_05850 [Pseudomonadota bacterium]
MQIVLSSVLALVVILALAFRGPYKGLWLFFAVTPLGAAAAVNLPAVGGASILVSDLVALTMFALVVIHRQGLSLMAGSMRIGQPGFWMMLLFIYATFSTLLFPSIYAGQTEVFSLSRTANETGIVSIPLRPSSGNLTQLFRLGLGVAIFFAVATVFRVRPSGETIVFALAVATGTNAALGWLDVATFAVGAEALLEPIRSANYAILYDHRMAGLKRMIGGFPEASAFGYFSLGLFAFWFQYWLDTPRSRLVIIMLIIAAVAVLRSTSSASYVAMLVYLVTAGLIWVGATFGRETDRRSVMIAISAILVAWLGAITIFASYEYVATVQAFLDRALFNKLDGASGVERLSWNAQAFKNFVDTNLMGAGLGSVRASSWFMATLASLGLIGTGLFFALIFSVLAPQKSRSRSDHRFAVVRALQSACIALLISACLTGATPDLGVFFFAFCGLVAGLRRGVILELENGAENRRKTADRIVNNGLRA